MTDYFRSLTDDNQNTLGQGGKTDYFSELSAPKPPVNQGGSGGGGSGFGVPDFLTGADRQTRATRDLPPIIQSGILNGKDPAKVAALMPILLLTQNPQEFGQILTNTFPEIGITQDEKGNFLANDNESGVQAVINPPGLSKLDVVQGAATAAAFTPAAKSATLGTQGIKNLGASQVARRMVQGGLASGATELGIQGTQEALGGEFDETAVKLSAGLGGLAEGLAPAKAGLQNKARVRRLEVNKSEFDDILPAVQESSIAKQGIKEFSDVDPILFKAQKTAVPSQLKKQSFVPELEAFSTQARKAFGEQNKASANILDDFLQSIAPDNALITGATKVRTASQRALDITKVIRAERASPLYKAAFKDNANVNLRPIKQLIAQKVKDLPEGGEISKTLNRVVKLISGKKETTKKFGIGNDKILQELTETSTKAPSLKQLHNAKLEIDQMLSKFGENSLGNTTKKEIQEVRNLLVNQIDDASPLYKEARLRFAANSPNVEALRNSPVGKIANLKDAQLKTVSKTLFDASETNPKILIKSKTAIEAVDPSAWNEIVRTEFERRLGSVKSSTLEGGSFAVENVPGQLHRAIFGNDKTRKVLYAGLNAKQRTRLKHLETYLNRARLGRPGGSPTAGRETIKDELKGGFGNAIRNLIKHPIDTAAGIGADASFDAKVRTMGKAYFDPEWTPRLDEIIKADPNFGALGTTGKAMTQLLNDIASSEVSEFPISETFQAPEVAEPVINKISASDLDIDLDVFEKGSNRKAKVKVNAAQARKDNQAQMLAMKQLEDFLNADE